MPTQDTRLRYGTVAMTLHWLIALLVVGNVCSGIYFAELAPKGTVPWWVVPMHKSSGLTVLVLSVLLLLWRLTHKWPALPQNTSAALRALARATHVLFYFFIIAIPFVGWAMVSASPRNTPTYWYWLFEWPRLPFFASLPMENKKPTAHLFGELHAIFAYFAIALVLLHVAGALYHQFIRRDQVLKRMWFGTRVTDPVGEPTKV
jgi:cytochrome b561